VCVCVCVGVRQLTSYSRQRAASLQSVICEFAESKIQAARDTYTLLHQSLQYFRQLHLTSTAAADTDPTPDTAEDMEQSLANH